MPQQVELPIGDALMHRTATECRRLEHFAQAVNQQLAERHAILLAGLAQRHTTRHQVDDIHIRRDGPTGIIITMILNPGADHLPSGVAN